MESNALGQTAEFDAIFEFVNDVSGNVYVVSGDRLKFVAAVDCDNTGNQNGQLFVCDSDWDPIGGSGYMAIWRNPNQFIDNADFNGTGTIPNTNPLVSGVAVWLAVTFGNQTCALFTLSNGGGGGGGGYQGQ